MAVLPTVLAAAFVSVCVSAMRLTGYLSINATFEADDFRKRLFSSPASCHQICEEKRFRCKNSPFLCLAARDPPPCCHLDFQTRGNYDAGIGLFPPNLGHTYLRLAFWVTCALEGSAQTISSRGPPWRDQ